MNKYEKLRNDIVASNALDEAKSVSKYLRKTTGLSIVDRNKIAENYFKKTLTQKFSNLYSEASGVKDIFGPFLEAIGEWVVSLFGKMGEFFKIIGKGITRLGKDLLGSTSTGFMGGWKGSLNKTIFTVFKMDITLAQLIGVTAILGICLWAVYKLGKWLYRKFRKSESYVPMFTEKDNKFLIKLKRSSELNEGFGDMLKSGITKFAMSCIEKGKEVLPKIQETVSKINNPKVQQFVSQIGPAFSKAINSPTMKMIKTTAINSAEVLNKKISELTPKVSRATKDFYRGFKRGLAGR